MNVPDTSGKINQVSGLVDYVTISGGKTYFSINDQYYDSEYLDSVVSLDYLEYISREPSTEKPTEQGGTEGNGDGDENQNSDGTENA